MESKQLCVYRMAVMLLLIHSGASFTAAARNSCFFRSKWSLKKTMAAANLSMQPLSSMTSSEEKIIQDALYRIRQVNYMPDEIRSSLMDFTVNGVLLGRVRPNIAEMLCSVDDKNPVFQITEKSADETQYLTLTPEAGASVDSRTASVNRIMKILADRGIVKGWRNEDYPIKRSFDSETVFGMERSSVSLIGAMEYGVHINGIVRGENGKPDKMWIARRSANKSKYPGMLDHLVAGGQPVGLSLLENVIKECEEEAGIDEQTTRVGLQAAGAISYCCFSPRNDYITRCVLFCYDLYLPASFQPRPVDGEVEDFFLWDMDELKASLDPVFSDPIKPNCYPVCIDYLLRSGNLSPDTPGYLDVLRELRSGDCI